MTDKTTTGSDAVDLLPCPFCGGTNIDPAEWSGNDGNSGPGCGDCGALAETARDWNRRVPIAQARAAAPAAMSKAQIDAIVYKCRQDGKDTTYDIVNAALAAAPVIGAPTAPTGVTREFLERCLSSMKQAVTFGETGTGRPPSQTCMFEIEELEAFLSAPTATGEPVAWIVHTKSGDAHLWFDTKESADRFYEANRFSGPAGEPFPVYAAPAPQQAAPLTDERIEELHDQYGKYPHDFARAIERELSAGSAASAGDAQDGWSQKPPTEQGEYWHWNGEEDTAPYIYHILWSGSANKCFVSIGQYGITEASLCDEFGGWWKKIDQPAVPIDRAAIAATKEKKQ